MIAFLEVQDSTTFSVFHYIFLVEVVLTMIVLGNVTSGTAGRPTYLKEKGEGSIYAQNNMYTFEKKRISDST